MTKLEEIKAKAIELFELVDSYEEELFHAGIKMGKQVVYNRVCNAFKEEMKKHGDLNGKPIKDIPSAERILNASSVIVELFPELEQ